MGSDFTTVNILSRTHQLQFTHLASRLKRVDEFQQMRKQIMSDNLDTSHAPVLKFNRSSSSVKEIGTGSISITRHQNTTMEFLKVNPRRRRPVHSIQVVPSFHPTPLFLELLQSPSPWPQPPARLRIVLPDRPRKSSPFYFQDRRSICMSAETSSLCLFGG